DGSNHATVLLPIESLTTMGDGVLTMHADIKMSSDVRDGFERFKKGKHAYGAMYVHRDGLGFGSHKSMLSMKDAKNAARTRCRALADVECVLYATLSLAQGSGAGRFPKDSQDFVKEVKAGHRPGEYTVIASNSLGDAASFHGNDLIYSRERALEACERVAANRFSEQNEDFRSSYSAAGLLKCRIFGMYH
ncbi:MAG: hypothetical protein AAF678_09495, partial [Pseudomonadota bacterium]